MKIVMIVNERRQITEEQSTALLLQASARLGHEVYVTDVGSFTVSAGHVVKAQGRRVTKFDSVRSLVSEVTHASEERFLVDDADAVWVRTNPARDPRGWAHQETMSILRVLEQRGVPVVNSAEGLRKAASKRYLLTLGDEFRPKTLITRSVEEVEAFSAALEGQTVVIKPLSGTHGRGVFFVNAQSRVNLRTVCELLFQYGYVVVQEFVPEAALGDLRVMVLGGRLWRVEGEFLVIHRRPGDGELRSNVHAGGTANPGVIPNPVRLAALRVAQTLENDGIWMAGIDFVGDQIVEVNVHSPGGFGDAQRFYGPDFAAAAVKALESHVLSKRA